MVKLASFFMATAYAHELPGFDHDHLHVNGPIYTPPAAPAAPMGLDPLMLMLLLGDDKPALVTMADYTAFCAKTDDAAGCNAVAALLDYNGDGAVDDCLDATLTQAQSDRNKFTLPECAKNVNLTDSFMPFLTSVSKNYENFKCL